MWHLTDCNLSFQVYYIGSFSFGAFGLWTKFLETKIDQELCYWLRFIASNTKTISHATSTCDCHLHTLRQIPKGRSGQICEGDSGKS
jgi:hypothetical protein